MQKIIRTSVVLPRVLDRNFDAYCAQTSKSKSQVIKELLVEAFVDAGLDPEREPQQILVRYTDSEDPVAVNSISRAALKQSLAPLNA